MNKVEKMLKIIGNVEKTTLPSEISVYRNKLTEQEQKQLLIIEKQHVAGFKYDDAIDEIIEYIEDYIYISNHNVKFANGRFGWQFSIPKNVLKSIDFINDLTIKVLIQDFNKEKVDKYTDLGAGNTNVNKDQFIVANKLSHMTIDINGVVRYGELIDYSIRNNLYHELNHAYEVYQRLKRYNKTMDAGVHPLMSWGKYMNTQKNLTNDKYGAAMESILYRLWDPAELSAASTSTYAYLKSVGGERKDLAKDLQHSQAFIEYANLKKDIDILTTYNDIAFWNAYKELWDKKITFSTQAFKNWFIKRTNVYLMKYYHNMLTAAALYYDNTEEIMTKQERLDKINNINRK